jgi:hypothetical protein
MGASASAPGNVWAVTYQGAVLHFNGSKWAVKQFKSTGDLPRELTGVTALSATNVWVFGGPGATGGLGTWHYNGKTWTPWKAGHAAGLERASAVSPSSIWAIGSATAPYDTIDHFTGKTWGLVSAKALQGLQFRGIVALSDRNVWITASTATNVPCLLHYNGTRWTRIAAPKNVVLTELVPDGHGGLWLIGGGIGTNKTYIVHRSAGGAWGVSAAPGFVERLAAIPGASGLWASGAVRPSATGSSAVIWAHGSV